MRKVYILYEKLNTFLFKVKVIVINFAIRACLFATNLM